MSVYARAISSITIMALIENVNVKISPTNFYQKVTVASALAAVQSNQWDRNFPKINYFISKLTWEFIYEPGWASIIHLTHADTVCILSHSSKLNNITTIITYWILSYHDKSHVTRLLLSAVRCKLKLNKVSLDSICAKYLFCYGNRKPEPDLRSRQKTW